MGSDAQRGAVRGRVAHVFLAVAVALPVVAGLGTVTLAAVEPEQSALNLAMLALIGVGFVAVVVWVALQPQVRTVEIAVARSLLGLDLPAVAQPSAWSSRLRGLGWLAFLMVVGVAVATGFLYFLPTGLAMAVHPFTGRSGLALPGATGWHPGSGWSAAWLVPVGLVLLACCVGVVVGSGRLIAALAPRLLGPTLVERVAVAAERERRLAQANSLARDVHDGLGHVLTAMTVQITAARRLLPTDGVAADRALSAAEDLGRQAQADIDAVVGALRSSPVDVTDLEDASAAASQAAVDLLAELEPLLAGTGLSLQVGAPAAVLVPGPVAAAGFRVVREAMTNATRYGDGSARLDISLDSGASGGSLVVELRNPINPAGTGGRRTGAGLVGVHEHVTLAGGTLVAGPAEESEREEGTWLLRAELPIPT